MRWIMALCVLPNMTMAQDPPLDFYTGRYQMIGKDAEGLVDIPLRLDPSGTDLRVTMCGTANAGTLILPGPANNEDYIVGRIGAYNVVCNAFSTYEIYPLLACYADDGAQLTLWPGDDFNASLDCAP
jgi:hypothetical protein